MNAYAYTIEPIRGGRDDDPATIRLVEDAWLAVHGEPMAPIPPQVIGWRLVLLREGEQVEQREFMGGEEAYTQALDAGGAWLRLHGGNDIDMFTARAMQASRRMDWDHDYRHDMRKRVF